MKVRLRYLLSCLAMLLAFQTHAEVYKWVDDNGRTHFSDQKPAQLDIVPIELTINTYKSVSYEKSTLQSMHSKVVMYSTDWCGYCKQARRYFIQKHIPYIEYDIEKNLRAHAQYKKLGATGVPVILVGDKRMNGFSIAGFNRIYP